MKLLTALSPLAFRAAVGVAAAALTLSGASCMQSASKPTSKAPQLECSLASIGEPKAGGPVEVGFTLKNRSDQTVYVLQWYTPLEGLLGDVLLVELDGAPLPYQGPLAKRANPGKDSYLELAGGGSLDSKVDLQSAYELKTPGRYTVRFERGISDLVTDPAELPRPMDAHQPFPLACPPLTIDVR